MSRTRKVITEARRLLRGECCKTCSYALDLKKRGLACVYGRGLTRDVKAGEWCRHYKKVRYWRTDG